MCILAIYKYIERIHYFSNVQRWQKYLQNNETVNLDKGVMIYVWGRALC